MSVRCGRKNCGEVLSPVTDGQGRVVFVCRGCDRNRRGLCRDCPAQKRPRFMRCEACRRKRHLTLARQRDAGRYEQRKARSRAWGHDYRRRPLVQEHRKRYMRAYRIANPYDANDRAYARVYMAMRRKDPEYRAKQNLSKRISREKQRLAKELSRGYAA